jgi:hypothetical protein
MATNPQTAEERERLLDLGKDGIVICIDLNTDEGQAAVTDLSSMHDTIQATLATADKSDGFLLALYLIADPFKLIVEISPRDQIRQAIKVFADRAFGLGNLFSFAIIPPDQTLGEMVAELTITKGSA